MIYKFKEDKNEKKIFLKEKTSKGGRVSKRTLLLRKPSITLQKKKPKVYMCLKVESFVEFVIWIIYKHS